MANQCSTSLSVILMAGSALGAVATAAHAGPLLLAQGGKTAYTILQATGATEAEKTAVRELASHLEQVTGARFPVASEGEVSAGPRIVVGPGAAAKALLGADAVESLGSEAYLLRTVGKDLVLVGGRPRGTLYAVYAFLEEHAGCRWWAPGESTIPTKRTLRVPNLNVRRAPVMEYREPYWGVHLADAEWCARNRVNGGRADLGREWGDHIRELGGVHSFRHDIPPDRYFKEHPEWFSEIDGKRRHENAQLCMTNTGLQQEYARVVLANLRSHRDAGQVWVSQNDWDGYCECAGCKAINDREGTPAGALIHFVNSVAAEVEKEFPHVAVRTLAYDWSQKPPKSIRPRPNVIIWMCTTGTKYNVPLTHEWNQTFRENLDGWSKVCGRIYIWDYVTNFSAYLSPHPNLRTLGPNARYYADHHVKGVFYQGAYSAPRAEMAELRAWVLARLAWDPYRDAEKLIDEFLDGYYGPAGKHVRAYLKVFHDAIARTGEGIGMCEQPMGKRWLTLETLSRGLAHLRAARAAVAGDPDRERRVEIAELPLIYVFLLRWDELHDRAKASRKPWPFEGQDVKQVYDAFQEARKKHGIKQISEQNARDWFTVVEERVAVGRALVPPGCEELPRERWIDLQDVGFNRNGAVTRIDKDPAASDGSAVYLPSDRDDKLVHKQLWRVPLVTLAAAAGKPVRVFLSVRCELAGREGSVFRAGVDGKERVLEVRAAEVVDDRYHTYELGVFDDLRGWIHVWVAPAKNPQVKGIWIDRMWMVTP